MPTTPTETEPSPMAIDDDPTTRLLDLLRRELDRPELAYAATPTPLGGGYWAELFALRLTGAPADLSGELVLRIMPDDLAGRREAVIQRVVADAGFPAPHVHRSGSADGGLGRAYLLMDRAPGAPLLGDLSPARAVPALPRIARRLPRVLAATSVALHRLDAAPVVDALRLEVPGAWIDGDDLVANLALGAEFVDDPVLRRATAWLAAHRPAGGRRSICHGDLHPFNVLVDGAHATLLDWTTATVTDPAFDVAFTSMVLRYAPIDVPDRLRRPLARATAWLADRYVAEYRAQAAVHGLEIDPEQLRWHTVLQCTRALADVAQRRLATDGGIDPAHPFVAMRAAITADLEAIIGPA